MDITFLGTCSGTEPMPGRRHTSFAVEAGGWVYFFDAGEGCSHTAHNLGLDLLRLRAVFISHPHIDHIGGLPNLLWTVVKLGTRNSDPARALGARTIDLCLPSEAIWDALQAVARADRLRPDPFIPATPHYYADGPIYDDGVLRVQALHNTHLGHAAPDQPWHAFSFRIEAEGKALVYSGDIGHVSELEPLLDAADLVLMETGHHGVEATCRYLAARAERFGQLGFLHHGREILDDPQGKLALAQSLLGDRVFIADDGMRVTV